MTTLASKIINSQSEAGIPGLYIEVWEFDNRYHDPLGENTTTNVPLVKFKISLGTAIERMAVPCIRQL